MALAAVSPEMCIICSDSGVVDNLPWSEIADFQFGKGKGITAKAHRLSRRKENSGSKTKKPNANVKREEMVETQEEMLPVFVTCDAL
jgi:hypothetical protein